SASLWGTGRTPQNPPVRVRGDSDWGSPPCFPQPPRSPWPVPPIGGPVPLLPNPLVRVARDSDLGDPSRLPPTPLFAWRSRSPTAPEAASVPVIASAPLHVVRRRPVNDRDCEASQRRCRGPRWCRQDLSRGSFAVRRRCRD